MNKTFLRIVTLPLIFSLAADPALAGGITAARATPSIQPISPRFTEQAVVPALNAAFRWLSSFDLSGNVWVTQETSRRSELPAIALVLQHSYWIQHQTPNTAEGILLSARLHKVVNRTWQKFWPQSHVHLPSDHFIYQDLQRAVSPLLPVGTSLPLHIQSPTRIELQRSLQYFAQEAGLELPSDYRLVSHPGTYRTPRGTPRSINLLIAEEDTWILLAMKKLYPDAYHQWLAHEVGHIQDRLRNGRSPEWKITQEYPLHLFLKAYNELAPRATFPNLPNRGNAARRHWTHGTSDIRGYSDGPAEFDLAIEPGEKPKASSPSPLLDEHWPGERRDDRIVQGGGGGGSDASSTPLIPPVTFRERLKFFDDWFAERHPNASGNFIEFGTGIGLDETDAPYPPTTIDFASRFPSLQMYAVDRAIPDVMINTDGLWGVFDRKGVLMMVLREMYNSSKNRKYFALEADPDPDLLMRLRRVYTAVLREQTPYRATTLDGAEVFYKPFELYLQEHGITNVHLITADFSDPADLAHQIGDVQFDYGRMFNSTQHYETTREAQGLIKGIRPLFREGGQFFEGGGGNIHLLFSVVRSQDGSWIPLELWTHPALGLGDVYPILPVTFLRDGRGLTLAQDLHAVDLQFIARGEPPEEFTAGDLARDLSAKGYTLLTDDPAAPLVGIDLRPREHIDLAAQPADRAVAQHTHPPRVVEKPLQEFRKAVVDQIIAWTNAPQSVVRKELHEFNKRAELTLKQVSNGISHAEKPGSLISTHFAGYWQTSPRQALAYLVRHGLMRSLASAISEADRMMKDPEADRPSALAQAEQLLDAALVLAGPDPNLWIVEVLHGRNKLSRIVKKRGDSERAEALLVGTLKSLDMKRRRGIPPSQQMAFPEIVLDTSISLAALWVRQRKSDWVIDLLSAREDGRVILRPDLIPTMLGYRMLSLAFIDAGKPQEACQLLDVLDLPPSVSKIRYSSPTDPIRLVRVRDLAQALVKTGDKPLSQAEIAERAEVAYKAYARHDKAMAERWAMGLPDELSVHGTTIRAIRESLEKTATPPRGIQSGLLAGLVTALWAPAMAAAVGIELAEPVLLVLQATAYWLAFWGSVRLGVEAFRHRKQAVPLLRAA